MALLLPRSWLTKAKHQVIISVIPLEGVRRGKEGEREEERNISFLLWGTVYRSRISVSNTKQFYVMQLKYYGEFLLPPCPICFFLPLPFEWPTWKTSTTCKKRAWEGNSQDVNLWSAPVFQPRILQALWNAISYLVVIIRSITFHMVKLAMPCWFTMNFNKASMLPMLLYGNPFSQHHLCLSEIC